MKLEMKTLEETECLIYEILFSNPTATNKCDYTIVFLAFYINFIYLF